MNITENVPSRKRVIQGQAYAEAGIHDFAFQMPRPFVADDFSAVASRLGIDAAGLANQVNQVLAENLTNNMASKIKAVVKHNSASEENQKPLPDQSDLDALVASYDFSGARAASGEATSGLSNLEREQLRLAKSLIRALLKENGYGDAPAPVMVAKKDEEPGQQQVSFDEFVQLSLDVVEGNYPWDAEFTPDGAPSPYFAKRQELLQQAEANLAATRVSAMTASLNLGRAE